MWKSQKKKKQCISELEHQLQQMKIKMEKNNQEASALKIVREVAIEVNEELRETQS
jgi:hypothetical protein